jgi:hypothetical protein
MADKLIVEGTVITASEMSVDLYDITGTDTKRNVNGELTAELIARKQKIELKFNLLSGSSLSTILKLFSSHSGGIYNNFFFDVTYLDPIENANRTAVMYVGDRNNPHKLWRGNDVYYSNVKFNLIER